MTMVYANKLFWIAQPDFSTDIIKLLSLFCPSLQAKIKNQIPSKFVVWWQEIYLFLFTASRALLQSHAEFNRTL